MSGPFPSSIPPFPGLAFISQAQLVNPATALPFPGTVPPTALVASLSIEGGNVRWGVVGALPTGSTGTPLWGTTSGIMVQKSMFSSIRFILMTGSASATLNIDYYTG